MAVLLGGSKKGRAIQAPTPGLLDWLAGRHPKERPREMVGNSWAETRQ